MYAYVCLCMYEYMNANFVKCDTVSVSIVYSPYLVLFTDLTRHRVTALPNCEVEWRVQGVTFRLANGWFSGGDSGFILGLSPSL